MVKKRERQQLRPPAFDRGRELRQKVVRVVIHFFAWVGIAVLFYVGFSLFFDTPVEHRMKSSTAELRRQYRMLDARYDSLEQVLANVGERDRNVFKMLFEAEPYDLSQDGAGERWAAYEELLGRSTRKLNREFADRIIALEMKTKVLLASWEQLEKKVGALGGAIDDIPSIQPVVNHDLTLLTASFGLRLHPFYKTMVSHQGVDFTVPEGSRVFATADGRVRDVIRSSTQGITVILAHGNGYETQYSNLSQANVARGQQVRRGDIIALSGDTGLSLAPHLHYEIRHNGMRIDPVHYFFMELGPSAYQKMQRIARVGMQSFD